MNLAEIRQKYPQYDQIPDGDLATRLHQKFYPQLSFEDFSSRIGYSAEPAQPEPTVIDRAIDAIANSGKIGMPNLPSGESLPPAPDEVAGLPQIVFPKPSLPQSLPSMATAEPMPTPGPAVPDALTSSHVPTVPVMPAHTARPQQNPAMAIPGEAELELGRALQHVPKWHGGDIGELGAGVLGYMLQRAAAGLGFLAHGAGAAEAGPFVDTPKPTLADLAKEAQRTTDTFAHQPPTVEGIHGKTQEEPGAIAKAVSYPFEKAKEYAERASQWVYDNTGSAWLSGLTAAGDELLMAALPFMKRLRGGPGKGVVPVDSTEFGEGLSEGARLRNLAKKDPAAFRAAFEEALKKRMNPTETQPEAPGEAQAAKPAETMGEHFGPQAEAQAPPPVKFANAPRGTAADLPNMPLADLDKVPMEQRVKLMFPDLSDAEAKQVADSIQAKVTETIENAPPLRADQGSPPMGEGLVGGRGPGAGGEDLQRQPEAGGAAAFIEPPRGEAPTRTQPRTEIARPGGNGDRIKAAYDALKAERGVENIEIADIRDRAGASQAEIEAYLKRQAEAGKAVTTTGDFSVADEHTRSGAVKLSNPERPDLLARLDEAERATPAPQAETPPAPQPAQEPKPAAPEQPKVAPQPTAKTPRKAPKPTASAPRITTLGGAIKAMGGVNFLNLKGEVKDMPPGVRIALIRKTGEKYDLAEQRLKEDGWLAQDEELAIVLRDRANIRRGKVAGEGIEKQDRNKTEQEKRIEREMAHEPEAPPDGDYVVLDAEDLPEGKKLAIIDDSPEGWDVYEVTEKDPFGVTLKDGRTVELKPGERVQVRKEDLGNEPSKEEKPSMVLQGERQMPNPQAEMRTRGKAMRGAEQGGLDFGAPETPAKLDLRGERVGAKEAASARKIMGESQTAPAGAASKGRYASGQEVPTKRLDEIEVSVKYQTEDGESVTVKQPASEALKAIDEQTERMKALQKCLES